MINHSMQSFIGRLRSIANRRHAVRWAFIAVVVQLLLLVLVMRTKDWSLQSMLELHDGVYYVAHLENPLLRGSLDGWDNIPYRALRVGYVLVALPLRWMGSVSALVVVHLLSVAVGAFAIREVAARQGVNEDGASLVWAMNPGALVAGAFVLPDVLAWTSILLCLLAMEDHRWGRATAWAVLAVLTKEASLVPIGLVGLAMWRRDHRSLLPAATAGVIHISFLSALVSRFGPSSHSDFVTFPFFGWVNVAPHLIDGRFVSGPVALAVLASALMVVWVWRHHRSIYVVAAVGQAMLVLVLSATVLVSWVATARIGGLMWVLLAASVPWGDRQQEGKEPARIS